MARPIPAIPAVAVLLAASPALSGQDLHGQKDLPGRHDLHELRDALGDKTVGDGWIYEDCDAGYEAARRTGKPLLVAFR